MEPSERAFVDVHACQAGSTVLVLWADLRSRMASSPGGFFSEGPSVAEKCSPGPETPWIQKWPCFALVVVGRGLLGQKVVRGVEGLVGNTAAYHDRGHAAFSGPPASGMQSLSSAAGFCSATVGSSPPPDRV